MVKFEKGNNRVIIAGFMNYRRETVQIFVASERLGLGLELSTTRTNGVEGKQIISEHSQSTSRSREHWHTLTFSSWKGENFVGESGGGDGRHGSMEMPKGKSCEKSHSVKLQRTWVGTGEPPEMGYPTVRSQSVGMKKSWVKDCVCSFRR